MEERNREEEERKWVNETEAKQKDGYRKFKRTDELKQRMKNILNDEN